jgi:hypothetical protein
VEETEFTGLAHVSAAQLHRLAYPQSASTPED